MKARGAFVLGLVAGVALAGVAMVQAMPRLMLQERASALGVEETVQLITQRVTAAGWVVSSVMPLDQSVRKHGGADLPPVRLVNICQAHHASRVLADPADRRLAVMMPCTIAVYEGAGGATRVATMNAGLMGRMFGGEVARVMAGPVASEQAGFVAGLASAGRQEAQ
jgi:uncharacterized protein (DUF302 family)